MRGGLDARSPIFLFAVRADCEARNYMVGLCNYPVLSEFDVRLESCSLRRGPSVYFRPHGEPLLPSYEIMLMALIIDLTLLLVESYPEREAGAGRASRLMQTQTVFHYPMGA